MNAPNTPPSSGEPDAAKPTQREAVQKASGAKPGILIVDDDVQIRRLLYSVLADCGFEVFPAGSAREAVETFETHRGKIALAIIDLFMTGQNGISTLKRLREIDESLCCCFVTGGFGEYSIDELFAHRAAIVFHKPFDLRHFKRAVRNLVFGPQFQSASTDDQPSSSPENERRRFPRWPGVPQDVLVSPMKQSRLRTLGTIVNRSLGGLSLVFDELREAGSVMQLRSTATPLEKWLTIEVRHARRDQDRWILGCRYVDPPALGILSVYG